MLNIPIPRVHLNGTSGDELHRQNYAACDALRDAIRRMEEAAPNARDYYPIGEGAFEAARRLHVARIQRLQDALREQQAITDGLQDQLDEIESRKHRDRFDR